MGESIAKLGLRRYLSVAPAFRCVGMVRVFVSVLGRSCSSSSHLRTWVATTGAQSIKLMPMARMITRSSDPTNRLQISRSVPNRLGYQDPEGWKLGLRETWKPGPYSLYCIRLRIDCVRRPGFEFLAVCPIGLDAKDPEGWKLGLRETWKPGPYFILY